MFFMQLSEGELTHILDLADIDGDGRISLEDFKLFLQRRVFNPSRLKTGSPHS